MKILLVILSLFSAMSAFASSETKTFFYDGSQDSAQLALRSEQTHTEYRYEQRRRTCYREEVVYRTTCRRTPQGQRECHTTPYYRSVPYTCIETVSIPYEVKDYDVEANINLSVTKLPAQAAGETFIATLNGEKLSLTATGSKKFFILLKKSEVNTTINGSIKFLSAVYEAELIDATEVVKSLEMSNIAIKNSILSFKMGPINSPELIGFSLNVAKAPLLGSNRTLFDRELALTEIQLNQEGNVSSAEVDLEKLGVKLGSGRHTLTPNIFFKHQGTLLNASQFERIEASRTLIYKL